MAKKRRKQRIDSTPNKVYTVGVDTEEIRSRRERLGLTQLSAAKAAGWLTQQQWAHVENGERPDPRISTLATVARVLKCKVDDLLKR